MPRQSQPTRKQKPGSTKQPNVVKKARKDDSHIHALQDRPNKRNKKNVTEMVDTEVQPFTTEEQQVPVSKSQTKSKMKAKVAGILSTQDSNVSPPLDTSPTMRRRSSRVVATKTGKPSYVEPPSSTTEEDDSDDESDVSLVSMPKSNYKNVASGDPSRKSTARGGRKPTKTSLQLPRSSPIKSPKKKTRVVATVGTPLYSGVDIKKPSPASSSIKEITKNMWKENEGDWRVEGAMDY